MSKLTFPTSRFLATSAVLALTTAFTLSACAPPQPPPKEAEDISPDGPLEGVEAEATSSNDAPEPAGDEPAVEFDAMSPPEKIQYMKTTVAPRMKLVFQEHDAEEFAEFSCATCHGPGAKDGNFSMPTDSLPALDKEETEEHPEMTKFMAEMVVPEMAKLLGEELEGEHAFGCFDCHTKKN